MTMKRLLQRLDMIDNQSTQVLMRIDEGTTFTSHLINTFIPQVEMDAPSSTPRPSISSYLPAAEEKISAQTNIRNAEIRKRARAIAEELGPTIRAKQQSDPIDKVTLDIPLFIRLLEFAKEDAKSDLELHNVATNAIALNKTTPILSMKLYDAIVAAPGHETT